MKKITVIGIGKLGLPFALLCERGGYSVLGCDKRKDYVVELKSGEFKSSEPKVEELLQSSENFEVTTDISKAIAFSDILFIFVPTPSLNGGEYDHQYVDEVVIGLEKHDGNIAGKTLVINCTVMPKYCKSIQDKLSKYEVNVIYNPEFIQQGDVVNGLEKADFVLMGCDKTLDITDLVEVYKAIMKVPVNIRALSLTGAEIAKIGLNCFLTLKIAYANIIGEIAINSGEEENVSEILAAIGSDSRIGGKFLGYGFPASGICLPRDARALRQYMLTVGIEKYFISALINENDRHLQYLKDYFIQNNPDKENPFIFNQLTYKKGVDILTESGHYKLCKELLDAGYKVNIFESDVVVDAVLPELSKYGNRVAYGNKNGTVSKYPVRLFEGQNKKGYVIEL